MNQLFASFVVLSVIVSACLCKKVGIIWAVVIAIALPICLFALATAILVLGGDK